jgi:hypothetical protein
MPLVAIVGAATWLVQAQDLMWPLVASSPEHQNGAFLLLSQLGIFGGSVNSSLLLPPSAILVFAAVLGAAQLLYLDRLVVRTGQVRHDRMYQPVTGTPRQAA